MTSDKTVMRRRYSAQFKAQVVAQCDEPSASVAKVAMSHGINTNVVHGWRKQARQGGAIALPVQQEFVPIRLACLRCPQPSIEAEVRRGPLTMKITWPTSAAADFACWSRELLR